LAQQVRKKLATLSGLRAPKIEFSQPAPLSGIESPNINRVRATPQRPKNEERIDIAATHLAVKPEKTNKQRNPVRSCCIRLGIMRQKEKSNEYRISKIRLFLWPFLIISILYLLFTQFSEATEDEATLPTLAKVQDEGPTDATVPQAISNTAPDEASHGTKGGDVGDIEDT